MSEPQQVEEKPWLFKKGQSGNPGGRPPDLVTAYGRKHVDTLKKRTHAQAVVEAAFRKAEKGDSKVLPYLLDRLFGKVVTPIEVTGLENLAERLAKARARTTPELEAAGVTVLPEVAAEVEQKTANE